MEKCRKWLPIVFSAMALVGSIVAGVWAASADRSNIIAEQSAQAAKLDDHETRLRNLEREIPAIATNTETILDGLARLEARMYEFFKPGRRMPSDRIEPEASP